MEHDNNEVPLSGGNLSSVVRVGATVRRAPGPWTRTVHHLLNYLGASGFGFVPEPLGFDEQGREVLSFIVGEVGDYPLPAYMWDDAILLGAARFLRSYHDATTRYVPPEWAVWQCVYPDSTRHEVICHNDFAPYNLVFEARKPKALIDFDFAGPGPRTWDVAYGVYRFVPLSWEEDMRALGLSHVQEQGRRLRLFCDAYGLNKEGRGELLDMVKGRLEFLCDYLASGAAGGDVACRKMVDDGHLALYQRELAVFELHRSALERGLLGE